MTLARLALRMKPNDFRTPATVQTAISRRIEDAPIPKRLRRSTAVREESIGGFRVITLTPKTRASGTELIYNHGGAYVFPLLPAHWWIIEAFIKRTGCTVTVPFYGLAPARTVGEALPFLATMAESVRDRAGHQKIFMAGDSAGGGLSLAHAVDSRNSGRTAPEALLLFSPWVDCTMTNPDISPIERLDPMLSPAGLVWCAGKWASGRPLTSPEVSPINDSLQQLPPTYIYQGDCDIFLPDAKRYRAKAELTGTPVELRIYAGGFHVFAGATFTPESRQALNHAAGIIQNHI